jgi:chromosome partitioning protein
MKVISIISQKGGTGKTTLSLHLAVAAELNGFPTVVLDLDSQASAAGWADNRKHEHPAVISLQANRLSHALKTAADNGAALAIVDTAPHTSEASMSAAEASDLVLIPVRPGILDLRAIATTAKIVKIVDKQAFAILNSAPPRAPKLVEDALLAIKQHNVAIAPVILHQRSAYTHSLTLGLTASEYEKDGKAAEEIANLFAWIKSLLSI